MQRRFMTWLLLLCAALAAPPAVADSWRLPETETYRSGDGTWRLTVEPRALASQLAYFLEQHAVDDVAPGGLPGDLRTRATGRMERLGDDGTWQLAWDVPLANDVAPVDVLVSDSGRVATFDNWHIVGYGDTAIVFYDPQGARVRALALAEFLPPGWIEALPHSASSFQWRGQPSFEADGETVVVPLRVPGTGPRAPGGLPEYVEVRFDARTGAVTLPDGGLPAIPAR